MMTRWQLVRMMSCVDVSAADNRDDETTTDKSDERHVTLVNGVCPTLIQASMTTADPPSPPTTQVDQHSGPSSNETPLANRVCTPQYAR